MTTQQNSFCINDPVEWTSRGGFALKTKVGKIEVVVPAGKLPADGLRRQADATGMARDHESYMVRVPTKSGKGKGKLYWPRTADLRKPQLAAAA